MAESTSIWKKEIRLRRRRASAQRLGASADGSMLGVENSSERPADSVAHAEPPPDSDVVGDALAEGGSRPGVSIWKEIHEGFSRGFSEATLGVAAAAEAAQSDGASDDRPPVEPIGLEPLESAPDAVVSLPDDDELTDVVTAPPDKRASFLRRERHLRRRRTDEENTLGPARAMAEDEDQESAVEVDAPASEPPVRAAPRLDVDAPRYEPPMREVKSEHESLSPFEPQPDVSSVDAPFIPEASDEQPTSIEDRDVARGAPEALDDGGNEWLDPARNGAEWMSQIEPATWNLVEPWLAEERHVSEQSSSSDAPTEVIENVWPTGEEVDGPRDVPSTDAAWAQGGEADPSEPLAPTPGSIPLVAGEADSLPPSPSRDEMSSALTHPVWSRHGLEGRDDEPSSGETEPLAHEDSQELLVAHEDSQELEEPAEEPPSTSETGTHTPTPEATVTPSNPLDSEPAAPKAPLLKRDLHLPRVSRRPRVVGAGNEVVGVRIGSTTIAAARVRRVDGRYEVVQIAQTPLPAGVVVGGELREPDALTNALKSFFDEHRLPRKAVRLGVASNRIGVRVLEVPLSGDPALFDNVVRFRAQELLPIPLAEAVLDQITLAEVSSPQGPMRRILVAFAHRDLVSRYADACKRAHLKLVGIDFDAFALLRALDEPREEASPNQATVAVSIGHERTIFAVAEGEVCDFTRVLEWGGVSLSVSLAHELNLAPSETAPIKHALSLGDAAIPPGLTEEQNERALRAVRSELQVLARELLASLQFYQSRPESLAIGEILLSGGGAQLDGIADELQRLIGVPVRGADPIGRVELGKKVEWPIEAGSLPIAIGLGMAA